MLSVAVPGSKSRFFKEKVSRFKGRLSRSGLSLNHSKAPSHTGSLEPHFTCKSLEQLMNIQSTLKASPQSPKTPTSQPQEQASQPTLRPVKEQWVVGDKTYTDLASLMAEQKDLANAAATYKWTAQDKPEPFTLKEKFLNAGGNALMGAGGGALAGAGFAAVGGFFKGLDSALGAFATHQPMRGTSVDFMTPMLICGGVAAAVGALVGFGGSPENESGEVRGKLSIGDGKAEFFPKGRVENRVDLQAFADSPVPEVSPEIKAESQPVKNAIIGATAGAATVPGAMIPLLGLVIPAGVGSLAGTSLDQRTSFGGAAGIAAGFGVTAATFAALGADTWAPMGALAGGLAVGGALFGDKIITGMNSRPAQRNYGEQWWTKHKHVEDRS